MKKTIKKFALSLALIMCFSPFSAFAAENTLNGIDDVHTSDVQAKYIDRTITPEVYSIDVVWEAMQFTYSNSGTKEWNPETHQYGGDFNSNWSSIGNTVTVTNHSNKPVNVNFSYEKASEFSGISGALSVSSDTLSAGVEGDAAGADKVTSALTLSGTLKSGTTEYTKVGTVKIALN